jgi:hypothetical protein
MSGKVANNENKTNNKKREPKSSTEASPSQSAGGISPDFCILNLKNIYRFERELTTVAGKIFPDLVSILTEDKYIEPEAVALPPGGEDSFKRENDQFGLLLGEHKAKLVERVKRIQRSDAERPALYHTIFGNMSAESRQRVMQAADWADIEKKRDPLRLWLRIKATHLVNDDSMPMVALCDGYLKFWKLQQHSGESIIDFNRRHIEARAALVVLTANVPNNPGVSKPEIPPPALHAIHFVKGLDGARYAHYRAELYNQTKLRGAKFPATLDEAFNEANNHVVVTAQNTTVQSGAYVVQKAGGTGKNGGKKKAKDKAKSEETSRNPDPKNKKVPSKPCHWCHGPAPYHWTSDCPDKEFYENALSLARTDLANKSNAKAYFTAIQASESAGGIIVSPGKPGCFVTKVEYAFKATAKELKDFEVLSDNECAVPIFRNPRLLINIRKAAVPIEFVGINGEGTPLRVDREGELPGFGYVYLSEQAQANVLSWAKCHAMGHSMEWDMEKNEFRITPPDMPTRVFHHRDGLYVCDFSHTESS